jgi:peptide/nickel transport system ATP-binding protein
MMAALEVQGLEVRYRGRTEPALKGIDLSVAAGRTLGVLGESGCGKSTLAQALVGLAPASAGRILYGGEPFVAGASRLRPRAAPAQIVFQDPQTSFNPRRKVWRSLAEPLAIRGGLGRGRLRERAAELAAQVGISAAQIDRYPGEFSGGQRQRLAIARALAAEPAVLILDEPTSALDVSIQAQVLNLLLRLQRERGTAYVFISHDVAVIRHMSDEVAVMRSGSVVESGPAAEVLAAPVHPYTRELLAAAPRLIPAARPGAS